MDDWRGSVAAHDKDEWYCEEHPQFLMGHEGCTGAGVIADARIDLMLNTIRLLKQEVREAGFLRDMMAAEARRLALDATL